MTASHHRPLPTGGPTTECAARPRTTTRVLSATIGALLLTGALAGAAPALATDAFRGEPLVGQQLPGVVVDPAPSPQQTFSEPVPPIDDPTAISGTDPVTGFAINARTGFLVHPPTGYLIEPETDHLLFADSLVYTNLRYDEVTGGTVGIEGETPVPPPAPATDAEDAAPTDPTAAPSAEADATSEPTASAAPAEAPSAVPTVATVATVVEEIAVESTPDAAGTASTPAIRQPSRSATPTASDSTAALADDERTSLVSMAPATWIGGGVLAAALMVGGVLAARRRGQHQS